MIEIHHATTMPNSTKNSSPNLFLFGSVSGIGSFLRR
jgi:hypothetical protein